MAELLQIASFLDTLIRYPTVFFTVPLALILLYWIITLVGGLGFDFLDGLFDGAADAAVDGALDGAVDGAADGAADVDGHHGRGGMLAWLDVGNVPITIAISIFVLAGWTVSAGLVATLGPGRAGLLGGTVVLLVAGAAALAVTKGAVKPLKKVFTTAEGPRKAHLIGRVCEITTLRVTDKYGQAELADGGAGLVIQVRSTHAEELSKGSKALIYGYDAVHDVFQVRAVGHGSESDLAIL